MRPGGSSFHGANLTPEATQYVGHVMGNSGVEGHWDDHHLMVEVASPISSRPPALQVNFDESAPAVAIPGVPDEDDSLVREEGERGAASANRWPRPETLTLLKIRSDMDADFREATLKGPLWEDVSRKMSEMGYNRSAKKCKEKFENVHKYYKRTKEGRARRQDGKSYRFFTELEALHATVTTTSVTTTIQGLNYAPPTAAILPLPPPPPTVTHINSNQATSFNNAFVVAPNTGNSTMLQSQGRDATPIISNQSIRPPVASTKRASADVSVQETSLSMGASLDSSKSSEETQGDNLPKRIKRSNSSGLNTNEMMNFFRNLMKRVVEKQLTMQQRFFEDAEKRKEDRMVREEAWRTHEMGRLSRELDILAQERALSASRDAAMIFLLQKFTGAATAFPLPSPPPPTVQLLPTPSPQTAGAVPIVPMAEEAISPRKQPNNHQKEQPPEQPQDPHTLESIRPIRNQACTNVAAPEKSLTDFDPASSRWPKVEVLALIKLRSGLESRYQEAGTKGPLWEEISAELAKMGYRRSSKRCKEKWENINKYFRKMKESNKTRQEDAKTCPYFHELEALHKKKMLGGTLAKPPEPDPPELIPQPERLGCDRMKIMRIPVSVAVVPANSMAEAGGMELGVGNNGGSDEMQIRSSTGFELSKGEEGNVVAAEKPVDIVRDLMEKRPQHQAVMDDYSKMEDPDEDANSVEDDFEDEHDCYEARYRNQNGPAMAARVSDSFVTMIR